MEETDTDSATDGRARRECGDSDGGVDRPASIGVDREPTDDPSPDGCDLRAAVVEAIGTLPPQSKLVLLAVLARDRRGATPSATGEVYNTYADLCAKAPVDPLSQRRVTDLLEELDTFGLVSAAVVSEGRYGRTRVIESSVAPGPARGVLLTDDRLGRLADGAGTGD